MQTLKSKPLSHRGFIVFLLLSWILGLPFSVQADIYRFVDPEGVVHFSNVPTDVRYQLFFSERRSQSHSPLPPVPKFPYRWVNPASFETHIEEASRNYRVEPHLIRAIIRAESNFDPYSVSRKGACGLMQLMPETAKDMGVTNIFDPRENIHGGTRYIRLMLDQFRDLHLALAAYNAGPDKVTSYRGIPPFSETRTYVSRVIQIYQSLGKNSVAGIKSLLSGNSP